jgi:hypothetical protein
MGWGLSVPYIIHISYFVLPHRALRDGDPDVAPGELGEDVCCKHGTTRLFVYGQQTSPSGWGLSYQRTKGWDTPRFILIENPIRVHTILALRVPIKASRLYEVYLIRLLDSHPLGCWRRRISTETRSPLKMGGGKVVLKARHKCGIIGLTEKLSSQGFPYSRILGPTISATELQG